MADGGGAFGTENSDGIDIVFLCLLSYDQMVNRVGFHGLVILYIGYCTGCIQRTFKLLLNYAARQSNIVRSLIG
jgi:hypothetical protein